MEGETVRTSLQAAAQGRLPSSVGVAARATLSVHALNNEGSRNNALIPRQVNVALADGVVQVNAVSGDMLKHSFVDRLRELALDANDQGVPLCEPCRRGDPNRSNADDAFRRVAADKATTVEALLRQLAARCVIDDVAGLLVTLGNRNAPRPSRVQFGWLVGVPDLVRTGHYTHVKLMPGAEATSDEETTEGGNLGQNIFTRPASSGAYAAVVRADVGRIGFEDLGREMVVEEGARRRRVAHALEALYRTLTSPDGAQVNTQLPHVQAVAGAVSVSFTSAPAVVCSPLNPQFVEEMGAIAVAFGRAELDMIILPFARPSELGVVLEATAALFSAPAA